MMAYEQRIDRFYRGGMVGLGRLELPTSRLSGVRSNQAELQARNDRSRSIPLTGNVPVKDWLSKGMRRRRLILVL